MTTRAVFFATLATVMKTIIPVLAVMAGLYAANADSAPDYVAHEWGTFTSIQGSDGVPLRWNPFESTDLPGFVFDRTKPSRGALPREAAVALLLTAGKDARAWYQRMETPVIYFHSRDSFAVDVHVQFPGGLLTEWYPQVTSYGPGPVMKALANQEQSHLRWEHVRVLSAKDSRDPVLAGALLAEPKPSHYYPARETRANLVESTRTFVEEPAPQRDRMLFYRGAGDFDTPLRAGTEKQGYVELRNHGEEPLGPLIIVRVDHRGMRFAPVNQVSPGGEVSVPLANLGPEAAEQDARKGAHAFLRGALVNAGLYEDEAAAMLATWQDAWLEEPGLRVLYLLPRAWTDRILPLDLTPAPQELVRVMVGRADVFTPEIELAVADGIRQFSRGEVISAVASLRALKLGRFVEPAIRRVGYDLEFERQWVLATEPDLDRESAWQQMLQRLIQQLRAEPEPVQAAAPSGSGEPAFARRVDHLAAGR
jgi:hypothetical protein